MKKITLLMGLFLMSCASIFAQAPQNAPDVMLQGFYWDSYSDKGYGRTKWADLQTQVDEISESFDLVWLPPSAKSSGGTGYHPKEWSNQNGDWGSATQLKNLIKAFKAKGTRCVADIVINHRDGNYNWTDFCNENFGTYGSFTLYPSAKFICKDDECTKNGHSATGNYDAGYERVCDADGGYCASRDLDHSNTYLQGAIKAYLKWMKNEMGYDGWRYDLVKGYLGKYTKMYNEAGGAYYSVGEYWDGDYGAVKKWINETGNTSTAFDFPNKYATFNNGLASKNFGAMINVYKVPNGLCGADEMKRYATTFIDNHDTFRDGSKYGGDWTIANAVLLAQPGIPCVFYPHWKECKSDIKKMIATRKAVGVHSQSACTTAGGGSYYQSTTTGKKGTLICFVGSGWSAPSGYTKACGGTSQGTEWAYYTSTSIVIPDTGGGDSGDTGGDSGSTSNGSYSIRVNGTTDYNATYVGKAQHSAHEEYKVSVKLNAGDTFVTYDLVNKAGWVMEIEPYGEYANFTASDKQVTCNVSGCYDFYIKMLWENDTMYIGPGTDCSGGGSDTGDTGGGSDTGDTGGGSDTGDTGDTPTGDESNFYIRVNGTTDYMAYHTGLPDFQGREQYAASVELKAGDKFVCYDKSTGAEWVIPVLEEYDAYKNFSLGTDAVSCNTDGCYDIYIKLMFNDDTMYIGNGTMCSGGGTSSEDNTGGETGGETGGDTGGDSGNTGGELSNDYYLIGYINGEDHASGEDNHNDVSDYKFVNGKVTANFTETSYVYIKTGDNANWYMTKNYIMPNESGASAKLYNTATDATTEKIGVPAGDITFTLVENSDGSLTLSYNTGSTSAIVEAEAVNLSIYPNPTTNMVYVNCDEAIENITINSLNGSEVISTNSAEIDLSSLSPSIYFVNIMLQNGDIVRSKVIRK